MARTSMVTLILFSLLCQAAAVRTTTDTLEEALDHEMQETRFWKRDNICCCTEAGDDQVCSWQEARPLDVGMNKWKGSGCNWLSALNPFAEKKRVFGFHGIHDDKFFQFDPSKYGKNCKGPSCAKEEELYKNLCEMKHSPEGKAIKYHKDEQHQYIEYDLVSLSSYLDMLKKEFSRTNHTSPSNLVTEIPVIVVDEEPVVQEDEIDATDVSAIKVKDEEEAKKLEARLTNGNLKECEKKHDWSEGNWTTIAPVFCSDACEPHATRKGTQTPKKGCATKLAKEKYSNAEKYCKNVCEAGMCETPAATSMYIFNQKIDVTKNPCD